MVLSLIAILIALLWLLHRATRLLRIPAPSLIQTLGIDIPEPPIVTLDSVTSTSVLFHWAPSDKNVVKYIFQLGGIKAGETDCLNAAVVLKGLRPNTNYILSVIAVNPNNYQSHATVTRFHTQHPANEYNELNTNPLGVLLADDPTVASLLSLSSRSSSNYSNTLSQIRRRAQSLTNSNNASSNNFNSITNNNTSTSSRKNINTAAKNKEKDSSLNAKDSVNAIYTVESLTQEVEIAQMELEDALIHKSQVEQELVKEEENVHLLLARALDTRKKEESNRIDLRAKIKKLEDARHQLELKKNEVERSYKKISETMNRRHQQMEQWKSEMDEAQMKLNSSQEIIDKTTEKYNVTIKGLMDQIESLKLEISEIEKENSKNLLEAKKRQEIKNNVEKVLEFVTSEVEKHENNIIDESTYEKVKTMGEIPSDLLELIKKEYELDEKVESEWKEEQKKLGDQYPLVRSKWETSNSKLKSATDTYNQLIYADQGISNQTTSNSTSFNFLPNGPSQGSFTHLTGLNNSNTNILPISQHQQSNNSHSPVINQSSSLRPVRSDASVNFITNDGNTNGTVQSNNTKGLSKKKKPRSRRNTKSNDGSEAINNLNEYMNNQISNNNNHQAFDSSQMLQIYQQPQQAQSYHSLSHHSNTNNNLDTRQTAQHYTNFTGSNNLNVMNSDGLSPSNLITPSIGSSLIYQSPHSVSNLGTENLNVDSSSLNQNAQSANTDIPFIGSPDYHNDISESNLNPLISNIPNINSSSNIQTTNSPSSSSPSLAIGKPVLQISPPKLAPPQQQNDPSTIQSPSSLLPSYIIDDINHGNMSYNSSDKTNESNSLNNIFQRPISNSPFLNPTVGPPQQSSQLSADAVSLNSFSTRPSAGIIARAMHERTHSSDSIHSNNRLSMGPGNIYGNTSFNTSSPVTTGVSSDMNDIGFSSKANDTPSYFLQNRQNYSHLLSPQHSQQFSSADSSLANNSIGIQPVRSTASSMNSSYSNIVFNNPSPAITNVDLSRSATHGHAISSPSSAKFFNSPAHFSMAQNTNQVSSPNYYSGLPPSTSAADQSAKANDPPDTPNDGNPLQVKTKSSSMFSSLFGLRQKQSRKASQSSDATNSNEPANITQGTNTMTSGKENHDMASGSGDHDNSFNNSLTGENFSATGFVTHNRSRSGSVNSANSLPLSLGEPFGSNNFNPWNNNSSYNVNSKSKMNNVVSSSAPDNNDLEGTSTSDMANSVNSFEAQSSPSSSNLVVPNLSNDTTNIDLENKGKSKSQHAQQRSVNAFWSIPYSNTSMGSAPITDEALATVQPTNAANTNTDKPASHRRPFGGIWKDRPRTSTTASSSTNDSFAPDTNLETEMSTGSKKFAKGFGGLFTVGINKESNSQGNSSPELKSSPNSSVIKSSSPVMNSASSSFSIGNDSYSQDTSHLAPMSYNSGNSFHANETHNLSRENSSRIGSQHSNRSLHTSNSSRKSLDDIGISILPRSDSPTGYNYTNDHTNTSEHLTDSSHPSTPPLFNSSSMISSPSAGSSSSQKSPQQTILNIPHKSGPGSLLQKGIRTFSLPRKSSTSNPEIIGSNIKDKDGFSSVNYDSLSDGPSPNEPSATSESNNNNNSSNGIFGFGRKLMDASDKDGNISGISENTTTPPGSSPSLILPNGASPTTLNNTSSTSKFAKRLAFFGSNKNKEKDGKLSNTKSEDHEDGQIAPEQENFGAIGERPKKNSNSFNQSDLLHGNSSIESNMGNENAPFTDEPRKSGEGNTFSSASSSSTTKEVDYHKLLDRMRK